MDQPLFFDVPFGDSKRSLQLYNARECDALACQEWLDRHLRGDYLFKKGHLASIIKREYTRLYAVLLDGLYVGTIVYYHNSVLHNIMIDPDYRGLGIGEACIKFLNPSTIRAKTNMQAGDPVPFYAKQGYTPVGVDPERPHIVVMTKEPTAEPTTMAPGLPSVVPPSPASMGQGNTGAGGQVTLPAGPGSSFNPNMVSPPEGPLLPHEINEMIADATAWRELKAKQQRRQQERTKSKRDLDEAYARKYIPAVGYQQSLEQSRNGNSLHSAQRG